MTITVAFDITDQVNGLFNSFAQKQVTDTVTGLAVAINSSATSVVVDSAAGMLAADAKGAKTAILIGTEVILVDTISGNTLGGCTRGALGTTAASHSEGDVVRVLRYASHARYLIAVAQQAYSAVAETNNADLQAAQAAAAAALAAIKAGGVS